MIGTMMDFELTIGSILLHADRFHGDREIVSRQPDGGIVRSSYSQLLNRSRQLCNALTDLGVVAGDRVATLATNSLRHLEVYFAVPAMGAIIHTVNPRLFPEQVEFIINHAQDKVLVVEPQFVPLVQQIRGSLKNVRHIVVMGSGGGDAAGLLPYEQLVEAAPGAFDFPVIPERTGSALCYTSGTTGAPKGVLYSHRSVVLQSLVISGIDWFAVRRRDSLLPIVPMYHVNAWTLPFAAAMNGSKLVLPGSGLDSRSLFELISAEQVTLAAGVPTIWTDLIQFLEAQDERIDSLERVIVGGTAPTPSMIKTLEEKYGVQTCHGWGMTETSAGGLFNAPHDWEHLGNEDRRVMLGKQGRPPYPFNIRIVDADGKEAPWDGKTFGSLQIRGPSVTSSYYDGDGPAIEAASDGWLPTGDIAVVDPAGYVEIVDREKDVIKSGGEWISSIALENIAASHPDVAEAAVIGVPHPRWDERPLLIVVPRAGCHPDPADLIAYFAGKCAKWWIPEEAVLVDSIPRQATGKVFKAKLREIYVGGSAKSLSAKAGPGLV